MYSKGIVIHWDNADEYIEIDFDNLSAIYSIKSTKEWWREHDRLVHYNTKSVIKKNKNNTITIKLTYLHSENPHFEEDEVSWGTSIFTLGKGGLSGKSQWDDFNDQENSGECSWYKIDKPLIQIKEKTTSKVKKRNQEEFRRFLLGDDQKCVITGEDTKQSLEAAHIISVKNDGVEWPTNGIILRSDIHRLYDAGQFKISKTGKIIKIKKSELSDYYVKVLSSAKLPEKTLDRIKSALEKSETLD